MRQLASIKTITNLLPIEGRDFIELAIIDGWQVIVKKGEFTKGGKCIFCEIDSVLPDKPEFEFLKGKLRIRTMKMAGVVSQGICFPVTLLPKGDTYPIDTDVTKEMGITKYGNEDETPPERNHKRGPIVRYMCRYTWFRKLYLRKTAKKTRLDALPPFIVRTDETRIQNIPNVLSNKAIKYEVREKLEGQSGTFFLRRYEKGFWKFKRECFEFGVCSRNRRLFKPDSSSYWSVANKYGIEAKMKKMMKDIYPNARTLVLQGECVGPGIQGNIYNLMAYDLFLFNLIVDGAKVKGNYAEPLMKSFGMKWAPLIEELYVLPDTVNELLDYATAPSKLGAKLREGVVLRNYDKNISFKAVSPTYLMQTDF